MSIGVSRESISKLMTELVDSFPMEGEGRASISDFGKLLFAEGQTSTAGAGSSSSAPVTVSAPSDGGKDGDSTGSGSDQDSSSSAPCVLRQLRVACMAASDCCGASGCGRSSTQTGGKRVFTEIKGVPRQKQHDVRVCRARGLRSRLAVLTGVLRYAHADYEGQGQGRAEALDAG